MVLFALLAVFSLIAGVVPVAVAAPGEYSDLVFIYRDAHGVPIFPTWEGLDVPLDCVQPYSDVKPGEPDVTDLTYEGLVTYVDDLDIWLLPLWGSAVEEALVTEEYLEELGFEACDVIAQPGANYAAFMEEVPLSRLNLGRAPERVLQQQYAEVSLMLNDALIDLDAAGRLTADGVAVDSSPMNQSIFRELLVNGVLEYKDKNGEGNGVLFSLPMGPLEIAAMALGVAADKSTPISVDTVAYMNRIYGIPLDTNLDRVISDIEGTNEVFFDFEDFSYDRANTYKGCFEGYVYVDGIPELTRGYFTTPSDGDINESGWVFGGTASAEDIAAFALWADDARRVNLFMHDNSMLQWDSAGSDALCSELFPPDPDPDVEAPTVVVSAPVEAETLGSPVVISGSATDNVGVAEVRLEIYDRDTTQWWNGTGWQPGRMFVTATLGAGTAWTYDGFAPPDPQTLSYWMTVRSFDTADNPSSYVYRNFRVSSDAEAPTVVVSAPVEAETLGSPVVISGSATDNVGVAEVRLEIYDRDTTQWWNGTGWQPGRMFVTATLGAGTAWTYDGFAPPDPQTLSYWMTVRSFDTADNPSSYVYRNFRVSSDAEAPTVVVSAPVEAETLGSPVVISGSATDNVGVAEVRLEIYDRDTTQWWNGTGWQPGRMFVTATLGAGTAWTYDGFAPPDPQTLSYWMTVRSFDTADNPSSYVYRNFTIE